MDSLTQSPFTWHLWTNADSNAPIPAGSDAALVVWLKTIFI
jgi:hypothetical protein